MKKSSFVMSLLSLCLGVTAAAATSGLYAIPLRTVDGAPTRLGDYAGKVLLIVNTASQCGYTPQYAGLQRLAQSYAGRGLVVLGFPSNDFGSQEPGSNAEIKRYCNLNFHVTFPLFEKGPVSGEKLQPVYAWLLANAATHDPIDWNFEKFLIGREGKVVQRFKSDVTPESATLRASIEEALKP